jgi:hypothetical protein
MNIFIILLMALFMAGYYFMDAPNLAPDKESRTAAMEIAELKSVLSCVLRVHSDALMSDRIAPVEQNTIFPISIPCAEKYDIRTKKICGDDRKAASCAPDRANKSISNYIITTSGIVTENGAGKILELLGRDYPYVANLGIIQIGDDKIPRILSSGGKRREISKYIAKEAEFTDGHLAYITQYAVDGKKNVSIASQLKKIKCGAGQMPVFSQSQWTCVTSNVVPICSGDFIWDSYTAACIPDSSKRPLCQANHSAVMIDGVWECVGPEMPRDCPVGYTAQMNYDLMEWECVEDAGTNAANTEQKCDKIYDRIYGGGMAALRGNLASCNDCEKMIVHDDCTAECVPDAAATTNRSCYSGACQNFYFGFPDQKYIANARGKIPELENIAIPLTDSHSRNRRFNCMECPFGIDEVASMPPYVIMCK